jgi:hypothetical protein
MYMENVEGQDRRGPFTERLTMLMAVGWACLAMRAPAERAGISFLREAVPDGS